MVTRLLVWAALVDLASAAGGALFRSDGAKPKRSFASGGDWTANAKELVFIHGFAHSGTTIVGSRLKAVRAPGGSTCWIGRNLYCEAQWEQTLYPAWKPKDARNEYVCKNRTSWDWARAHTMEAKEAALATLVDDRPAAAAALLREWQAAGGPRADCRTWIGKDPRFDTLTFLPWLFQERVSTSLLVMRHPYAQVYLSDHSGGLNPTKFDDKVDQWLSVWRHALAVAREHLRRFCVIRMEDLLFDDGRVDAAYHAILAGAPAETDPRATTGRRLAIHGSKVVQDFAFERPCFADLADKAAQRIAAGETALAGLVADVNATFGYDLIEPTRVHVHGSAGCLFSRSIYAGGDAPVPEHLPAWTPRAAETPWTSGVTVRRYSTGPGAYKFVRAASSLHTNCQRFVHGKADLATWMPGGGGAPTFEEAAAT